MIFDWAWVADNLGDIWAALAEHIVLTVIPVGLGFLMAFPMALASIRWPGLYSPLLGVAGILFSIPTLALFVVMIPFTGLSKATAIIPLTLYTLLILLRNTVEGLKGVPVHVREAAEAMGYTRTRQLFRIELPLAVPVIVAGLRIATVNTIAYVAITALIGQGGLGNLFMDGFLRQFPTPLIVGLVLSVTLAVTADLGLLGVQRVLTPWQRDPG
ncbi:MAG: ABC transporter permease [Rubrobacteraceae bacterium]|nr:ABC transporter permease [Rubrobacteraceae bacterium]